MRRRNTYGWCLPDRTHVLNDVSAPYRRMLALLLFVDICDTFDGITSRVCAADYWARVPGQQARSLVFL